MNTQLTGRWWGKRPLAAIAAGMGILCLSAARAGAQSYADSSAESGPYFHLGKGSPFFESAWPASPISQSNRPAEYHPASAMDTVIGWDFNRNEAAEFELGFVGTGSNNVPGYFSDNARVANLPFLANFTLSLSQPDAALVPYVGAGAGGDDVISDPNGYGDGTPTLFHNENDVVFAWQAFAGLRFKMNARTSLGLGYKYFAAGTPGYPPTPNTPAVMDGIRTHSVLLTLSWKF